MKRKSAKDRKNIPPGGFLKPCFPAILSLPERGQIVSPTKRRKRSLLIALLASVAVSSLAALFIGVSKMGIADVLRVLSGHGSGSENRILFSIRLPRVLSALIAGAGLASAGLIMQTTLGNPMASPSTLGVSNAAVFGANVAIIGFAGGFLSTGRNPANYMTGANPFAVSGVALFFALAAILLILGLTRIRAFSPSTVILSGVAMGSLFTAATTILQFYATDVGLSAAVIFSFGDLGRATYTTDLIMAAVVFPSIVVFWLLSSKYNAILSGEESSKSMGVRVGSLRLVSLFLSSVMTAVTVSFLGVIGFLGVVCPHIVKRLIGEDHFYTIPCSMLTGSLVLLIADTLSRTIGSGSALPVGAVTSLLGAPFFLFLLLRKGGHRHA